MKNLFLFTILLISASVVSAQKVALHSNSGIQHFVGINGFTNAYTAAIPGDTIYLPGGGFTSPSNIDKQLYVFGAGHYPDSTTATLKTFINGSITLNENADGFRLEGVEITGSFYFTNNASVNNVIVKYSKINGQVNIQGNLSNPSNNLIFIDCILQGEITLSNGQNVGIFNSIIEERVVNSEGALFENNIFMFNYTGTVAYYNINGNNNILNNNLFINAGNKIAGGLSNQFYNNLFVHSAPYFGTFPVLSGNYYGVAHNSIFVNQTGYVFDYAHDYHLQNPTIYLGIDNTEVGVFGGTHSYKEGAVPSNPHIQFQNITPTTNTNGFLNIQINAAAQDK